MQISKRDYFAAQALTGLLARPANRDLGQHDNTAIEAFLYADAMMRHSKTLLDPVEVNPEQLAKTGEAKS